MMTWGTESYMGSAMALLVAVPLRLTFTTASWGRSRESGAARIRGRPSWA
jgi:hypothetical protein